LSKQQTVQQQETISQELALTEDDQYGIMDTLDDDIIRLELGGILVSELIYEFDMATKPNPTHVIGLTVHGANEMARLALRKLDVDILCEMPITVERPNSFKSFCKIAIVEPTGRRFEVWGEKIQPKSIIRKDGSVAKENDPNAEVISDMKAQRNAILKIFPPKTSATILKQIESDGADPKTKTIKKLSPDEVQAAARKARGVGRALAVDNAPAKKIETQAQEKPSDSVATQSNKPATTTEPAEKKPSNGNGSTSASAFDVSAVKTPSKQITEKDQQRFQQIIDENKIRFRVYGPGNTKEWIADDPNSEDETKRYEKYAALRPVKGSGAEIPGFNDLAAFLTEFGGTFIEPPNSLTGKPGFIYVLAEKLGETVIQRKIQ